MPHYPPPYRPSYGHGVPPVNGLLDQPDPGPSLRRTGLLRPVIADVEAWGQSPVGQMDAVAREQELNRQRAMAGEQGYASIAPTPSRPGRILDNLRYTLPRMVSDFGKGLARETPRGLLSLARDLGAESVGGPGGWITDIVDNPYAPRAPETGAGFAGGMGGLLAGEVVGGLAADAAAAARGVRELRDPEGSRAVGSLELLSAIPGFGMFAVPAVRAARAARGLEAMSTSRLEGAIAGAPQAKATGAQWAGQLRKAPGGVPKGELEWTGIRGLLAENPDRVFTRDELLRHMDERGVKLKETWRGKQGDLDSETTHALNDALRAEDLWGFDSLGQARRAIRDHPDFAQRWPTTPETEALASRYRELHPEAAKFAGSRIEGPSENYRELTIQLDDTPRPSNRAGLEAELSRLSAQSGRVESGAVRTERLDRMNEIQRAINARADARFTQGHYPEPNVLVHLRMSDRTYVNPTTGKTEKVLFLEEIQSDWHQKGRKQGYSDPASADATKDRRLELFARMEELESEMGMRARGDGEYQDLSAEYGRLVADAEDAGRGVPDAPFKPTGEWTELALRRATQEAVEGGYDRVAWSSGRQAADLNDLSKYLSEIHYDRGNLTAFDLDGNRVITKTGLTEADLPDEIGKEATERLLAQTPTQTPSVYPPLPGYAPSDHPSRTPTARSLTGLDLRVGGEGMIGYYDDIVPRTARKYGNQVGGIEIEGIALRGIDEGAEDLTLPQLRQGAKELDIEDVPIVRDWIAVMDVDGGTSTDAMQGFSARERSVLQKYEGDILGHLKYGAFSDTPGMPVGTNSSFAVTPEMRRIVGEGDQRLWGVGGIGLLGASAAARQRDDELDPNGGLLALPGRE